MNLFCIGTIGLLILLGTSKVSAEAKDQYAHITQDCVKIDLDTGDLLFNDDPIRMDQLELALKKSYSVSLDATSHSGELDSVSPTHLLRALEVIDGAQLDPTLIYIRVDLPTNLKRNQYHHIEIKSGRSILLNGSAVSLEELAENKLQRNPFVISSVPSSASIGFEQLLSVLRATGGQTQLAGLRILDPDQIEVEAQIYQITSDGKRDVLSAPKVTTESGSFARIRVVENGTGQQKLTPETDHYHQNDLANLGVRFFVKPQKIGDHLRVSGVTILTKLDDRVGVFLQGNIPIASYSCSKLVVPFSVIFPPNTDTVDFPVADMDGKKTLCRLTACVVDDRGMSRNQRERMMAPIF